VHTLWKHMLKSMSWFLVTYNSIAVIMLVLQYSVLHVCWWDWSQNLQAVNFWMLTCEACKKGSTKAYGCSQILVTAVEIIKMASIVLGQKHSMSFLIVNLMSGWSTYFYKSVNFTHSCSLPWLVTTYLIKYETCSLVCI
jgi:hypothetical protein